MNSRPLDEVAPSYQNLSESLQKVGSSNFLKGQIDQIEQLLKNTDKFTLFWGSILLCLSIVLLLTLVCWFGCKRRRRLSKKKAKMYSLIASSEGESASFFNPGLTAFKEGEEEDVEESKPIQKSYHKI
uniref:Uncharacterized protein n=1 Tax=Mesocestoides corti TaxID=53468 RepID=A0A5K3EZ48_MESCO